MNGRLIFAAGLLVGSTTGAVLTAAGLRDDPTPAPALAPAQQDLDGRLTEIDCTPTEEP